MAVTPADLLSPVGPVTPTLFPKEGRNRLVVRLTQYIANAVALPAVAAAAAGTTDAMTRAWALHLAFTDVYIRMSAQPLTVAVTEKGSHGYSTEQIRNMKALAEKYLDEFNDLIIPTDTNRSGAVPGTMAVATDVQW